MNDLTAEIVGAVIRRAVSGQHVGQQATVVVWPDH